MRNVDIRDKILADYSEYDYYYTDGYCQAKFDEGEIWFNKERFNKPTRYFLFVMLHEIGHMKNNTKEDNRSMSEFKATVWALEHAKKYGVYPSKKTLEIFQEDVYKWRNLDRIIGKKPLSKKMLTFKGVK